ncbi:MAG: DUF4397 domain-containing protein, partial [Deinococcota bacterium]|nr:DUF4397 domain-containing protein [Deinococcota bacterium]
MKKVLLVLSILTLAFGAILASAQQQEQLEVSPGEQAAIRVAHLSPDAPAVDISVNGVSVFTGIGYRDVSDYEVVPSGSVQIRIAAGGTDDAFIEAALTVEEGAYYTIAAMGFQANLEAMVFRDNLRAFPPSNGASVRFLHASPDAGAVDVAVRDGEVLVENLNFGQASSYFFVPADTYNIDIRAAGTDTVAFALDNVQVRAGHVYTHFVIGSTGDEVADEETTGQPAPEGEADEAEDAAPTTAVGEEGDQGAITITTSFTVDDEVTITVTGPDNYSETFLAEEEQTLDRLAPGTYTVTADAQGAEPQEVEVSAGETATVTIDDGGAQPTEPETEPGEDEGDDTGGTAQGQP